MQRKFFFSYRRVNQKVLRKNNILYEKIKRYFSSYPSFKAKFRFENSCSLEQPTSFSLGKKKSSGARSNRLQRLVSKKFTIVIFPNRKPLVVISSTLDSPSYSLILIFWLYTKVTFLKGSVSLCVRSAIFSTVSFFQASFWSLPSFTFYWLLLTSLSCLFLHLVPHVLHCLTSAAQNNRQTRSRKKH